MKNMNCVVLGCIVSCSLVAMDKDGLSLEQKLAIGRKVERLAPGNLILWQENNRRELRIWDENNKRELEITSKLDMKLLELESALLIKNLSHL